jgi:NifU-like protein involved in Fe-S cluster formation
MELFHSGAHAGALADATHRGQAGTPGQGPYLVLAFRVDSGRVAAARFRTYGCPAVIAYAEAACAWCEGRPLSGLGSVTASEVCRWVGGVPEGKEHCPELAAQALAGTLPL